MKTQYQVRIADINLVGGGTVQVATIEQSGRKVPGCEGCSAPCCQDFLRPFLTLDEFLSKKFHFALLPPPDWLREQAPQIQYVAVLEFKDGCCRYFDRISHKCTIFPDCPKACLAYDCREDPRPRVKEFVRERMEEMKMVWVKDTCWVKLDEPKRCRSISGSPKIHCPNMANFGFPRSNGIWAYCEEHMYGRRVRDGIVEIKVHPDSPAAKRGYV